MPTSNMNFMAANQQNPMAMLYQRSMAQNPLVMMNMNPMMGMGMMGMNGFNAMNMGGGVPAMNMMGGLANGITNGIGNGMGNINPMRFGVGPIGNLGLGNQNFMGGSGSGGQTSGVQRNPGMGMRQVAGGGGLNQGRIAGNSGPGPTRMATRGQHGFHPYAR
jgi:RNA-binding protein Musashi